MVDSDQAQFWVESYKMYASDCECKNSTNMMHRWMGAFRRLMIACKELSQCIEYKGTPVKSIQSNSWWGPGIPEFLWSRLRLQAARVFSDALMQDVNEPCVLSRKTQSKKRSSVISNLHLSDLYTWNEQFSCFFPLSKILNATQDGWSSLH